MKTEHIGKLLLFLLINVQLTFAQIESPGYVVTLDHDTLRGNILEGTDKDYAHEVHFFPDHQNREIQYTPATLLAMGFDYGREIRMFDVYSVTLQDSIRAVGKKLLGGKVDLYVLSYAGRKTPEFLLINNQTGKTVHLEKPIKREKKDIDGYPSFVYSKPYLSLLQQVKSDSNAIFVDQASVYYREKAILKDVNRYNENNEDQFSSVQYEPQKIVYYDVSGGFDGLSRWNITINRNRNLNEKTHLLSTYLGLAYHTTEALGNEMYIAAIPVGVRIHSNLYNRISGYVYGGIGVITAMNAVRFQADGVRVLPDVNVGFGMRVKAGNDAFFLELNSHLGFLIGLNAGYSF